MSRLPRLQRSLPHSNPIFAMRRRLRLHTLGRRFVFIRQVNFWRGTGPKTTKPTAGGGAVGFVGYGGPSGRRRGHPFRQGREEVTLSKIPDLRITQLS